MSRVRELVRNRLTIAILRATIVRAPWRFLLLEVFGREGRVARHRLRRSGRTFLVRHRTLDMEILHEVLLRHGYEPPEEVQRVLPEAPRVIDLGGNIGMFGVQALERWPQGEVTSYEPDPANAALLREAIAANDGCWEIVEAAATTTDGTLRFFSGEESYSRVGDGGNLDVPAVDVLPALAACDLAKIDIEGGEWDILRDPRFEDGGPTALAIEYHPLEVGSAHAEIHELLNGAGYETRTVYRNEEIELGVVWAWRTPA